MHEAAKGQSSMREGLALVVLLKDSGQNFRMLLLTTRPDQHKVGEGCHTISSVQATQTSQSLKTGEDSSSSEVLMDG